MGQLPYIPTRFHLCSVELDALEGEAREDEMRLCLRARFHAEKVVRSNCATQVKQMRPAPRNADERYRAQRQCFIEHLSARYQDLPTNATTGNGSAGATTQAKREAQHNSPGSNSNGAKPAAPASSTSSGANASTAAMEHSPAATLADSPPHSAAAATSSD